MPPRVPLALLPTVEPVASLSRRQRHFTVFRRCSGLWQRIARGARAVLYSGDKGSRAPDDQSTTSPSASAPRDARHAASNDPAGDPQPDAAADATKRRTNNRGRGGQGGAPGAPSPLPSAEPKKTHCVTVCMVPPPSHTAAWEALTRARTELRDPGLYRWPPHANLLYPFLDLPLTRQSTECAESGLVGADPEAFSSTDSEFDSGGRRGVQRSGGSTRPDRDAGPGLKLDDGTLAALRRAVEQCEPFDVRMDTLGTFGGRNRGVLWVYPRSFRGSGDRHVDATGAGRDCDASDPIGAADEPLVQLQASLERQFPACTDQRKGGRFTPHMTLSHFESLDAALEAKSQIEEWWTGRAFRVAEIYVLLRVGDGGQFKIAATLPLGRATADAAAAGAGDSAAAAPARCIQVHDPPVPFPAMPLVEEKWVREERMRLKARRNWKGRRRRPGPRRGPSKSTDTEEEIAAKRAARKAKRERLQREAAEAERAVQE